MTDPPGGTAKRSPAPDGASARPGTPAGGGGRRVAVRAALVAGPAALFGETPAAGGGTVVEARAPGPGGRPGWARLTARGGGWDLEPGGAVERRRARPGEVEGHAGSLHFAVGGGSVGVYFGRAEELAKLAAFLEEACEVAWLDSEFTPSPPSIFDQVGSGIGWGSRMLGKGMIVSASVAGDGLLWGSELVKRHTAPQLEPTEVSEASASAVTSIRVAASRGAKGMGHLAGAVGTAAGTLTSAAASTISGGIAATNLLPEAGESPSYAVQGAATVGRAAVEGYNELATAAGRAAATFLGKAATATEAVVAHRYGARAGAVAREGMETFQHLADVAVEANRIHHHGLRHLAQTTATKTAAELAKEDGAAVAAAPPPQGTNWEVGGA